MRVKFKGTADQRRNRKEIDWKKRKKKEDERWVSRSGPVVTYQVGEKPDLPYK